MEQRRQDWTLAWCLNHLRRTDLWLAKQPKVIRAIGVGRVPLRHRLFPGVFTGEQRAVLHVYWKVDLALKLLEEQIEILAYHRSDPTYMQALRELDEASGRLCLLETMAYELFDSEAFARVLLQIRAGLLAIASELSEVRTNSSPWSRLPIPYSRARWQQVVREGEGDRPSD